MAGSGLSHVSRAIRWIRDNYAEPLVVADLAALAGMSPSAFHRHFRAVTAKSPLQFQKRLRRQEARTLLTSHPGPVADIGHLVGYDSPTQFNREYRRLFGQPPRPRRHPPAHHRDPGRRPAPALTGPPRRSRAGEHRRGTPRASAGLAATANVLGRGNQCRNVLSASRV